MTMTMNDRAYLVGTGLFLALTHAAAAVLGDSVGPWGISLALGPLDVDLTTDEIADGLLRASVDMDVDGAVWVMDVMTRGPLDPGSIFVHLWYCDASGGRGPDRPWRTLDDVRWTAG